MNIEITHNNIVALEDKMKLLDQHIEDLCEEYETVSESDEKRLSRKISRLMAQKNKLYWEWSSAQKQLSSGVNEIIGAMY
ncbi:hypothetical protein [Liquorilactobacillus mali]|uniref:Uncharacterized protein n=1 Tax=Liquorilactobacillus mali KCTC 3596 = DSM 20444 TaxID=1046596 RepID=A0A0R2DZN3_9LACO|nr:hypothetical protein [Liquorilactobacillus mali]KRN09384.1 hypothetical protein FD00_GL001107 [Liquorilactobacillus mali KCTC 3596 = DSM 20444]